MRPDYITLFNHASTPRDQNNFIMKPIILLTLSFFIISNLPAQVYVDQSATGSNDGSSWADAYTNLQAALEDADPGSSIWIREGLYLPVYATTPDSNGFQVDTTLALYGGFQGTETNLEDRDWENHPTILSADILGDDVENDFENNRSDNAYQVIQILGDSSTIILDGLTLQNGSSRVDEIPDNIDDASPWLGGGLSSFGTHQITLRNCTFKQCTANVGPAFYVFPDTVNQFPLIIENTIFENNYGVYGTVTIQRQINAHVLDCNFQNNSTEEWGGAMILGNTNGLVEHCTFQNNYTGEIGGGIFFFQNSGNLIPSPQVDIKNCTFINNESGIAGGALLYNNFFPDGRITIDSCAFTQNTAGIGQQGGGGALVVQNIEDTFGGGLSSQSSLITNSTFENNTSDQGGAVYFWSGAETVDHHFENCTFIENIAPDFGGAMVLGNASTVIENCSFLRNSSQQSIGGGIFIFENSSNTDPEPYFEIRNSDFTDNLANNEGGAICFNNFIAGSQITLDGNYFSENLASASSFSYGGAVSLNNFQSSFTPYSTLITNLDNNFFESNSATNGGALSLYSSSDSMEVNVINSEFESNIATEEGGAIYLEGNAAFFETILLNNHFNENSASSSGGAMQIIQSDVQIEKNTFTANTTSGTTLDAGGGAISLQEIPYAIINNTKFSENNSNDGAALLIRNGQRTELNNVLIANNTGLSSVLNNDSLYLNNVTIVENEFGLFLGEGAYLQLQNTIIDNSNIDYFEVGPTTVVSKGGNLISDNTLEDRLNGSGIYQDFNNEVSNLDMDYVPMENSLGIDAGNPENITALFDLEGNDRIQGEQIDIGAIESPFVVSVATLAGLKVEVFPNPFTEELSIYLSETIEENLAIQFSTIDGKLLRQYQLNPGTTKTINVAQLPTGTYFLSTQKGKTIWQMPIIKQ